MLTAGPLVHLGIIGISGRDARSFLQAQFTNDITQLRPNSAQLSAWCTSAGRVRNLFLLVETEDEILILLPQEQMVEMVNKLRLFILRAQVTIVDRTTAFSLLGFIGEEVSAFSNKILGSLPSTPMGCQFNDEGRTIRLHGGAPRFLCITSADSIDIWQKLFPQISTLSRADWIANELLAGIPLINASAQEKFTPQMLNLDLIGAVNFNKGCYPGQEIVARAHYLGRIKRRLLVATGEGLPPRDGAKVADRQGTVIGEILTAQHTEGHTIAQAIISVDKSRPFVMDHDMIYPDEGQPMRLVKPPFLLPAF